MTSVFIFTTVAVLIIVGGVIIDPSTYYGVVRTAGVVVAFCVVARFLPSGLRSITRRRQTWTRADHLIMGIVLTWMGHLLLSAIVIPYRMFSDYTMPLELWNPLYKYLLPLSAALALVGGFFHLSARSVAGKPNWWIRIAIPLTILAAIGALVYNIRLSL